MHSFFPPLLFLRKWLLIGCVAPRAAAAADGDDDDDDLFAGLRSHNRRPWNGETQQINPSTHSSIVHYLPLLLLVLRAKPAEERLAPASVQIGCVAISLFFFG